MLLREVKFNNLKLLGMIGLSIRTSNQVIEEGFIGEVLQKIPHLADRKVIEQHSFFDVWVITIGGI